MSGVLTPPPMWSNSSTSDQLIRFFDLSTWFATGDTPTGTITATVVSSDSNDASPMTVVGTPSWDTGQKTVFISPGVPYNSPGPRIMLTLKGGTKGNTYTITATFTDSLGQTKVVGGTQYVNLSPTTGFMT